MEFLSVTATYTLPTHRMNNEWVPYTTYSSPTSLHCSGQALMILNNLAQSNTFTEFVHTINTLMFSRKYIHVWIYYTNSWDILNDLDWEHIFISQGNNNLHSCWFLMTSKCGLHCWLQRTGKTVWKQCLFLPYEFYMCKSQLTWL